MNEWLLLAWLASLMVAFLIGRMAGANLAIKTFELNAARDLAKEVRDLAASDS